MPVACDYSRLASGKANCLKAPFCERGHGVCPDRLMARSDMLILSPTVKSISSSLCGGFGFTFFASWTSSSVVLPMADTTMQILSYFCALCEMSSEITSNCSGVESEAPPNFMMHVLFCIDIPKRLLFTTLWKKNTTTALMQLLRAETHIQVAYPSCSLYG